MRSVPNPADTARHEAPVVVVGGGPVGMLAAYELSRLDIPCLLAEQNQDTTKWPKMDLTNCRSMEILRMMGIADEMRTQKGAVGGKYRFDTLFYTSCGPTGKLLTSWPLPSSDEWRSTIATVNDGSQPAEPAQRCSQVVFEAWLKRKCLAEPLIDGHFGWKYLAHVEDGNGVESTFVDMNGQTHAVRSKYLIGADGGGSLVRATAGIRIVTSVLPVALYLVHFRSRDLAERRPFGRFWHMLPPFGGFIVDQDENEVFTVHMQLDSVDADVSTIDPYEWVYKCFGGAGEPYRFVIDEIIVSSAWRPNFAIADRYISEGGHVVLVGDACHRNPPHGGYGMNSGLEDALAVAWRLSALTKGYGGPHLLQSYEDEQRPTMIRRLERCNRHVMEHVPRYQWYAEKGPELLIAETQEGAQFRKQIADFLDVSGSECTDRGIELDSRYKSGVIFQDVCATAEPEWDFKRYTPSTYPGARAPHLFLKDGKTSILDLFGKEWTLISFVTGGRGHDAAVFADTAAAIKMPLKIVLIEGEEHAHKIWGENHVLVRADGHVAWRGSEIPNRHGAEKILVVVAGKEIFEGYVPEPRREPNIQGMKADTSHADGGSVKHMTQF
ncbi:2,4-dichlorophenol 6-monooxygenase [Lipomyces tetrasporus]